jgi:hypothetical protein
MKIEEVNEKLELLDIEIENIIHKLKKAKKQMEFSNRMYNNWKEEAERAYYQREQLEEIKYTLTGVIDEF